MFCKYFELKRKFYPILSELLNKRNFGKKKTETMLYGSSSNSAAPESFRTEMIVIFCINNKR